MIQYIVDSFMQYCPPLKKRKVEDSYSLSNMPNEIITTIIFEGLKIKNRKQPFLFFASEGPSLHKDLFQTGRAVCKQWKTSAAKAYVWYMNLNNITVDDFGLNVNGICVEKSKKHLLENIYNDNIGAIRCIQSDHFNKNIQFYELLQKTQNIFALKIIVDNDLDALINVINLPKIEILNIEKSFNDATWDAHCHLFIEKIQNIQELSLGWELLTVPSAIKLSQSMKNLKVISVYSNDNGAAIEKLVGGLPNLESLTVRHCDNRDLAAISKGLSNLKKLTFSGYVHDLSILSNTYCELSELDISYNHLLNRIQPISNSFKKLKKLDMMCLNINDFYSICNSFPELEELSVHSSKLTDEDLLSISNSFPLLKILRISMTKITGKGIDDFLSSRTNKSLIIHTDHFQFEKEFKEKYPDVKFIFPW